MIAGRAFAAEAASAKIEAAGIPPGFNELARQRDVLVDIYFGGRKVGEARALVRPGYLKITDPDKLLAILPNIDPTAELSATLSDELPTNAGLVCPEGISKDCGTLSPEVAGIIYDEEHFRVDIFVNPKWLRLIRPDEDLYLSSPTAPLSLTSSAGLALSGSSETSPAFNLQNRTIIGFRNARIRSETSYASRIGFLMDTFVGEIDRPGIRYSAGLFWAPGLDLTGQRRIVGLGVGTQFDTRTDREAVSGTPVVLFLAQPARVDILVDGRLIDSRAYEAGNNLLDTSSLPAGSYSIVLKIHQAGGAVREERRFFAKNGQIAPVGQPVYFAYVGMLANTRPGRPVSLSGNLYYQLGTARRLTDKLALDFSVIGTSQKPIFNAGAWLITSLGRLRISGLVSTAGDRGALVQVGSGETGRLNVNFDLRRIWSHDGSPLIPLSNHVDTFDSQPLDRRLAGEGSYTQLSGSIGYRFGSAYLAVIGSLRKDRGQPADYSVGPSFNWPIVNANGLQVALQANAEITRDTSGGYVGIRMFFASRGYSLSSTVGRRSLSGNGDSRLSGWRPVGDTTVHFAYGDENGTDVALAGGVTRELDSTTAHAEGSIYSRFGSARGEILQDFERGRRTQYGLSLQTGAVANRDDLVLGGRNLEESGLVVSIDGSSRDAQFDVLVDGQPRGRVRAGERLPLFLRPYRSYSVRLRPVDAASVWYDTAARDFVLYPGNVEHVRWHVESLLTVFGRAVREDGTPVAKATVTSRRGIGQSNAQGYFQIETSASDRLSFDLRNGDICAVEIGKLDEDREYASLGKVICR
jgi:hypothetical protein